MNSPKRKRIAPRITRTMRIAREVDALIGASSAIALRQADVQSAYAVQIAIGNRKGMARCAAELRRLETHRQTIIGLRENAWDEWTLSKGGAKR